MKLSHDCEFGTLCDSLIRDVIIIGILDNRLRERLLREHDLTLENTIEHCKAAEETKFYNIHFILKTNRLRLMIILKTALTNVEIVQRLHRSVKIVKKLVTLLNVAPNKYQ